MRRAVWLYDQNRRRGFEIVPAEAEIVRQIFHLYNHAGWGDRKIANHLTNEGIPTPRMSEQLRKEAQGQTYNRQVKAAWAIVTIRGILDNDFYIGTLRQGKYTRAKINGKDIRRADSDHIVMENHHPPIIDSRTFAPLWLCGKSAHKAIIAASGYTTMCIPAFSNAATAAARCLP